VTICSGLCAGLGWKGGVAWMEAQPVCRDALQLARDNTEVGLALGLPLEQGPLSLINLPEVLAGTSPVRLRMELQGPARSATFRVSAEKAGEGWRYTEAIVDVVGEEHDIDVLAGAAGRQSKEAQKQLDALVEEADRLAGLGQYAEAIAAASKAIEIAPEDARGHAIRGRCWFDQQDLAQAEPDLLKATALQKLEAESWYRLGLVYEQTHRPQQCVAALTEVIVQRPDDGPAWHHRARCYEAMGELRQALAGAREACSRAETEACEMVARLDAPPEPSRAKRRAR
jgi:tetratricopeptide (TPR) repeat protein